jgi:hypothetical protein
VDWESKGKTPNSSSGKTSFLVEVDGQEENVF